jgi:membrane-bound metal-dependent hydrolase YbcI (DUF457 family)
VYILAHLAAGLVIGFLAAWLLHDDRWVIPCAIGSVLPDVIDKPLGYIVLGDSIGYGRIYFHTLYLFLVLVLIGVIWWQQRKSPVVLALALGVLSHQLLDAMWNEPRNWLYPFLGNFSSSPNPEYFYDGLIGELSSPSEWIIALALIPLVLLFIRREWVRRVVRRHAGIVKPVLAVSLTAIAAAGLFTVFNGLTRSLSPVTGWRDPADNIIAGIVILGAAWLLWVWWRAAAGKPGQ